MRLRVASDDDPFTVPRSMLVVRVVRVVVRVMVRIVVV